MMLQCAVFELENRTVVYQALQRFKQCRGARPCAPTDFSDYLIGAIAQQFGCIQTATFDRKLRGERGFELLE